MALGSVSTTTAITSIASSFDKPYFRFRWASLLVQPVEPLWPSDRSARLKLSFSPQPLLGQDHSTGGRHGYRMFKMGAHAAVFGDCGPPVFENFNARLAGVDHGFDSQDHAFA